MLSQTSVFDCVSHFLVYLLVSTWIKTPKNHIHQESLYILFLYSHISNSLNKLSSMIDDRITTCYLKVIVIQSKFHHYFAFKFMCPYVGPTTLLDVCLTFKRYNIIFFYLNDFINFTTNIRSVCSKYKNILNCVSVTGWRYMFIIF